MAFELRDARADPTLDVLVSDPATGESRRLTVLSGVVSVAPVAAGGIEIRVSGSQPEGDRVGCYLQGCEPLAATSEVTAAAEGSLTQLVVDGTWEQQIAYGIGEVTVQLVADQGNAGVRWPYLSFLCFGNQPLGVRYRVTLMRAT